MIAKLGIALSLTNFFLSNNKISSNVIHWMYRIDIDCIINYRDIRYKHRAWFKKFKWIVSFDFFLPVVHPQTLRNSYFSYVSHGHEPRFLIVNWGLNYNSIKSTWLTFDSNAFRGDREYRDAYRFFFHHRYHIVLKENRPHCISFLWNPVL